MTGSRLTFIVTRKTKQANSRNPRMLEHQTALAPALECVKSSNGIPQNKFRSDCCAVANPKPNYLGRTAAQRASLREIRILRYNHEAIFVRVLPNSFIRGTAQAAVPQVCRAGINVGQRLGQPVRQVLVEQQLHSWTISTLRSASAA